MDKDFEKELHIYMDRGGKFYIGHVDAHPATTSEVVHMKGVLVLTERTLPTQNPSEQQIMFNISPLMHTFAIDDLEFQWLSRHHVVDNKLKRAYQDFWKGITASRLDLSISPVIPPGLAAATDPKLASKVRPG